MFKKIIKKAFIGFMIEVFVTYLITILASVFYGDGNYHPVTAGLLKLCSTESGAVLLQFILSGLLGIIFGVSTIVWEIDSWSLVRQTVIHFLIITISMLIVAYICEWMQHSFKGFAIWIGMFVIIYIIIWLCCYLSYKRKTNAINRKLAENS